MSYTQRPLFDSDVEPPRWSRQTTSEQRLREALSPYVDLTTLPQLVGTGGDLRAALHKDKAAPDDVERLVDLLAALLRPVTREQITSPADLAGLLMVEMSHLEQEHLRVVLLNTKNYVLSIETVYIGTIDSASVRVGEVFKAALKQNAAALIVVHNHPSSDPTPSLEDIAVTRQLAEAGKLLGVDVLDHLVIGQGRWVSLRERRLGFQ